MLDHATSGSRCCFFPRWARAVGKVEGSIHNFFVRLWTAASGAGSAICFFLATAVAVINSGHTSPIPVAMLDSGAQVGQFL
jgi:hypothetical protein